MTKMCAKLVCVILTTALCYVKGDPGLSNTERNITVVIGRDATLTCNVENLQNYKIFEVRHSAQGPRLELGPNPSVKRRPLPSSGLINGGKRICSASDGKRSPPPMHSCNTRGVTRVLLAFKEGVGSFTNYVAWMRVDTQTILTIGPHVITKNHRVGVARGEPHAWTLTLRNVRPNDTGLYMCQINTEPMTSQSYRLQVYEPPDIDSDSSGEVEVQEGESIALHCTASGIPKPTVTWRREDLKLLTIGDSKVAKWEGAWLNITLAHRDMNGALLCIASNGVPPSVSKRILLHVLCAPETEIVQKMVGVYIGELGTLRCHVKAYPPPKIYWADMNKNLLEDNAKYETKAVLKVYEHVSILRINNASREDVGTYRCLAENSLGISEDSVKLYTLATTTEPSTSTERIVTFGPQATASAAYEFNSTTTKNGVVNSDAFAVILSQHQMQDEGIVTTL